MEKILFSACLLGHKVRYDGGHKALADDLPRQWHRQGRLILFCPETAAGLPTPRPPAEIEPGKTGADVLAGNAQILDIKGNNVTRAFVTGAHLALAAARHCTHAVLAENSPSCGSGFIFAGRFDGTRHPGAGVTTALLRSAGITVWAPDRLQALATALQRPDPDNPPCHSRTDR
jgi:uncharacterized protein YbbK (DUF523 family)